MKKLCCDGHNYTCGKNGWYCCVYCPRVRYPPKPGKQHCKKHNLNHGLKYKSCEI